MNTFFTADTHFDHANIIRYCNRPWMDKANELDAKGEWKDRAVARRRAAEMTEALIDNWNKTVTPNDIVYHLGDFAFCNIQRLKDILRRLNFLSLYYIWGNHDKVMHQFNLSRFKELEDVTKRIHFLGNMEEVEVEGQPITLNHYSMRVWNKSHNGAWHLYGHSHGTLPDDPNSLSIDVGVDVHEYRPISFDEVAIYMAKKNFKSIDHHGK